MPGLFGCYFNHDSKDELRHTLTRFESILLHADSHSGNHRLITDRLGGGITYNNRHRDEHESFDQQGRYYIWFDGELYNQREICNKYQVDIRNGAGLLLHLFTTGGRQGREWLRDVDGVFTAVIADLENHKLYIFNDRFGLRHLYWLHTTDGVFWASELKAMLLIDGPRMRIDELAVKEFFSFGYHLEDRTWFENVRLLPGATVVEYDGNDDKITVNKYWEWSYIQKLSGKINTSEIAYHLNELFSDGIRRRIDPEERIGITLSGGLDSRYIFASVPQTCKKLSAITFGKKGCYDYQIAKRVTKIRKTPHIFCEINEDNWLENRVSGVFLSDGQFNMMHLHGIESYEQIKKNVDVNLNGFLGDVVAGGSYLSGPKDIFDKIYLTDSFINKNESRELLQFRERDKEQFLVDNRGRRFIALGPRLMDNIVISRLPFMDYKFFDMVFSLPRELRENGIMYKKILLNSFPKYFRAIPWHQTMCPISYGKKRRNIFLFKMRLLNKIKRSLNLTNIPYWDTSYTDYPNWLIRQPARDYIEKCLLRKDALYLQYINRESVKRIILSHMERKEEHSNMIGLLLTFELWLHYVNDPKQVLI